MPNDPASLPQSDASPPTPDGPATPGISLHTQQAAPLERLLLGRLRAGQPTSLNQAVTQLCELHPELREALTAGAQPPSLAGPEAQRVWATLCRERWGQLYRTAGLVLTPAGEQRLNELWGRKREDTDGHE